jgi:hypothetical protein
MSDFERITDSLMIHISKDPSYAKGFIDGKTYARREIAYIFGAIVTLVGLFYIVYSW